MPVDNLQSIDIVSIDKKNNVVLTISDHLKWDKANEHLLILQDKINLYLEAIENGELYSQCPNALNKEIIISIVAKYTPNATAKVFINQVSEKLKTIGYALSFEVVK
jgi:hypothetical protein